MQNRIKIAALSLALALGATTYAVAQHGHHHDPAKEAAHLSKKLNLTPEQSAQIQPILADREQRMHTLMAATPDKKAAHDQRHAIMTDTETRLNAVLTPAQQEQFAAMRSKHHHHKDAAPAA